VGPARKTLRNALIPNAPAIPTGSSARETTTFKSAPSNPHSMRLTQAGCLAPEISLISLALSGKYDKGDPKPEKHEGSLASSGGGVVKPTIKRPHEIGSREARSPYWLVEVA